MKRITTMLAALCLLAMVAASADAEAAWWNRNKKNKLSKERTEKPEEMRQAHRFDWQPSMSFQSGVLTRDVHGGWRLGDMNVQLSRECVVEESGKTSAVMSEGRQAVVMGSRLGDIMVAWRVRLLDMDFGAGETKPNVELESSDANPNVGRIVAAPN